MCRFNLCSQSCSLKKQRSARWRPKCSVQTKTRRHLHYLETGKLLNNRYDNHLHRIIITFIYSYTYLWAQLLLIFLLSIFCLFWMGFECICYCLYYKLSYRCLTPGWLICGFWLISQYHLLISHLKKLLSFWFPPLSPKVSSCLGQLRHGSGSSSSSPTGNGFITKDTFGAQVLSRTTPVKTRRDGGWLRVTWWL